AIFLPRDLTQEHLGQVLMLQTHLTELLEAQARTARLWELARRRPDTTTPNRGTPRREGQGGTAAGRLPGRDDSARVPPAACGPEGRNGQGPEGGTNATVG